jgi:aryl-alcohol dehydrogenase-like predicted oxidoreductase
MAETTMLGRSDVRVPRIGLGVMIWVRGPRRTAVHAGQERVRRNESG